MEASPLLLDGWVEFNCAKWGLTSLRLRHSPPGAELPELEAVLYVDRRGRVVQPVHNPYMPVAFRSTPTQARYKHYHQWLEVASPLLAEMRRRGVHGAIKLPPAIDDVRPWQWAGYHTSVAYTFYLPFPHDRQSTAPDLRRKLKKAREAGLVVAPARSMDDVIACLRETEARQGFRHRLGSADLEAVGRLMGREHMRAYVCYTPDGEPAGASVALHRPGATALGWVMGTRLAYLPLGAAPCLIDHLIDDLAAAGATGLDMTGANLPSVAAAKASWGCALTPFFTIEGYGMRSLAKWAVAWRRFALPPAVAAE